MWIQNSGSIACMPVCHLPCLPCALLSPPALLCFALSYPACLLQKLLRIALPLNCTTLRVMPGCVVTAIQLCTNRSHPSSRPAKILRSLSDHSADSPPTTQVRDSWSHVPFLFSYFFLFRLPLFLCVCVSLLSCLFLRFAVSLFRLIVALCLSLFWLAGFPWQALAHYRLNKT